MSFITLNCDPLLLIITKRGDKFCNRNDIMNNIVNDKKGSNIVNDKQLCS